MTTNSELRVALVGTGFMGRLHSIAYAILPSFFPELPPIRRRVVADVTQELAQRGAKQFGYEEWAVEWEQVVTRSDVEIVDITTPNELHRPIAELALQHGKHVLCEKPLALSAEEARLMSQCAKRSGAVHMVAFNYRRCPAVLEAKRLIDSGALGKIFHFRALYLQDWAVPPDTPFTWRFSADQSGSGALGDIGSHALDLALYLVGEIASVVGLTETFVPARAEAGSTGSRAVDVDDCAVALLRFANGAVGTLEASRFSYGRKNFLTFEISGSDGALAFNWERSNELKFYSAGDRKELQGFRTIITGPAHPYGEIFWPIPGLGTAFVETQVIQIGDFVRAISEGRSADTCFEHGWRVQEAMEAILASARAGQWKEVEPRFAINERGDVR
ncbi:MAG: Gfo/Idh/MocA family oxidoreductase [Verrucomicrobia bacterium]|nr:Gfo/Idh/MocA family oxidoreductase [Verrucomicrobiota bacterium]